MRSIGLRGSAFALLGLCIFLLSRNARAEGKGAASLDLAHDAWNRGEIQEAEKLLDDALKKGGLSRDQTLDCYVRLGSANAVLGRKKEAQAAFRTAALMDAGFAVPSDAGKKAVNLADQVRKEQLGFGQLELHLDLPKAPKVGAPIGVTVTMDGAHTTLFTRVGLSAKESTSGKTFAFEMVPAETMQFTIPGSLALPNGDVAVHVEALDASDNQLTTSDGRVRIVAEKPEPVATKKGGFWSSPWPYLIGGVVLAGAAAGGVGIFLGTQSSAQVNVGAPTVRAN